MGDASRVGSFEASDHRETLRHVDLSLISVTNLPSMTGRTLSRCKRPILRLSAHLPGDGWRHRIDRMLVFAFEAMDIGLSFFGHLQQDLRSRSVSERGGEATALLNAATHTSDHFELFRHRA
jgi:hypothetical protein